jgi:hypothetical protein
MLDLVNDVLDDAGHTASHWGFRMPTRRAIARCIRPKRASSGTLEGGAFRGILPNFTTFNATSKQHSTNLQVIKGRRKITSAREQNRDPVVPAIPSTGSNASLSQSDGFCLWLVLALYFARFAPRHPAGYGAGL